MTPLLAVDGLSVRLRHAERGWLPVVRGVSFTLKAGEILGLVGESGSGKTQTALAILGLTPIHGEVTGGSIAFAGRDLPHLDSTAWQQVRGRRIGLVPQESFGALNPCLRVGAQIAESLEVHLSLHGPAAWRRALELLALVGIADPARTARNFPHELSGGMRQRATIAIALACKPELLIADEPTTALDAVTCRRILELLSGAVRERGASLLLITHDLSHARSICDRIAVIYAGQIVEEASTAELFRSSKHPYTRGLLAAGLPLESESGSVLEIPGRPPNLWELPAGCAFHPRCDRAAAECTTQTPPLTAVAAGAFRCFHPCP